MLTPLQHNLLICWTDPRGYFRDWSTVSIEDSNRVFNFLTGCGYMKLSDNRTTYELTDKGRAALNVVDADA